MKSLSKVLLSLTMMASMAGCASDSVSDATADADSNGGPYVVGVVQSVQHDALDAATEGFIEVLEEELGDSVTIYNNNASGDTAQLTTIVNQYVTENVDLIMANSTGALQAAVSATSSIPILGTSVTEYGVALDIDDFDGVTGINVSGTSDLAPLEQQAAMFDELIPDAKTIGILYCSAEPNSEYQAKVVQQCLEDAGKTVIVSTFADTNDIASVTQSLVSQVDAIYIPTDNTAASCTETINNICEPAGIPIIAGEEGIMSGCGIASLSISYYELGRLTGEMAVKVLTGESDITSMEIEYYGSPVKKYYAERCEALNITVPDDYVAYEAE